MAKRDDLDLTDWFSEEELAGGPLGKEADAAVSQARLPFQLRRKLCGAAMHRGGQIEWACVLPMDHDGAVHYASAGQGVFCAAWIEHLS